MTALCSTAALFKVFETFAVFTCLVIHRIGNQGSQVWFGASDFDMSYKSSQNEIDAEVIGCGILTCMTIVTLTILLSYMVEGRKVVQSTVLDMTFCFVAAVLLVTAGAMCCFTYNSVFALSGPPIVANLNISKYSQQAAGAMGVMCIITGLLYLADFFYTFNQRNYYIQDGY